MKNLILVAITLFSLSHSVSAIQILSKSKLEKCEKVSESEGLNCTSKIVIDLAVPSESSGREASLVAEIVEAEENSTDNMRTLRVPPVITINKSAAYALYELTYIRDVAYKPQEFYVQTRKCEPDAAADVVKMCERLRDENGHIIEHTQAVSDDFVIGFQKIRIKKKEPIHRLKHFYVTFNLQKMMLVSIQLAVLVETSAGSHHRVETFYDFYSFDCLVDKLMKGKANTAHCLRFTDDWFHVFGIGQRSVGFSIRIEVKTKSKISEVIVGPENRTAISGDKFLRVNLVGDYVGYTDIPSFDDFYLIVPRQGGPGQPQNLGSNFSMWMLLERVRFTLDGLECNKIGVSYEAFNTQPDFCAAPFWSCLHNQLWNFWDADQNRISRNQVPLYCVERRFERINKHPNAGSHAFSIGITEVLNTNLLLELRADDIEYVYQRSPGKFLAITVPTFEALTQFGTATITTKNIGEVEASYSLTFDCSSGVSQMEEQFYIMKPNEVITRSFKLYPTTDQAARYACADIGLEKYSECILSPNLIAAILKDSDFSEVDRAECQFTTTATVIENGSQIPFQPPKTSINGFFESIEVLWNKLWTGFADFVTGKSCRRKCSGFFDFSCHIQYICMSWILMFGLFLAIFPTAIVLLWLLHQKGLFDPLYDWWEDHVWTYDKRSGHIMKHHRDADTSLVDLKRHHRHEKRHHKQHVDTHRRRSSHSEAHRHKTKLGESDYHYYLHHVHKDKHKHGRLKNLGVSEQVHLSRMEKTKRKKTYG